MPVFEYVAIDPAGKKTKGTIDADNIRVARQRLRTQQIFPTDIKESAALAQRKNTDLRRYLQPQRASIKDIAIMTRQLATLTGAGLPLVNCLQALAEQTDSAVLMKMIIDVREKVEEGSSFSKALSNFPKTFPRLYINMVSAGEASGTLDAVLARLADYLEAQLDLRTRVRSALMYPVLMLFICVVVIIALFMFVVPKVVEIFIKQGATLPLPTRIMIVISDFLLNYWFFLALLVLATPLLIGWYYRKEKGRAHIDLLLLKLPIYGSIYRKICTARVALTLSSLLAGGVQLLNALDIVKRIVGNYHVEQCLEGAKEGVREGRSLAKELAKGNIFPSMLAHMIAVGEKSGTLEEMLQKAGTAYEKEVNATLEGLTSLLEPFMIMVVGGVVLCIVVSVLMPMMDMIEIFQRA